MIVVERGKPKEYRDTETKEEGFSVSQIRRIAYDPYAGIPEQTLAAARHRGTLLHRRFWRMLAAQDQLLEAPAMIAGLEGYCLSMDRWIQAHRVQPVLLEVPSMNHSLGYGGTPDAGILYEENIAVLTDLKTGAPTVTDPMQLIAYQKMEQYTGFKKLLDLYIQPDGKAAIERWITPAQRATQWPWFLSAIGVLKGRMNHACL